MNAFQKAPSQGFLVRYDKNKGSGSAITARLGWKRADKSDSTATWDSTWYSVGPGQYIKNTWHLSYPCNYKWVGLLQVSGQGIFRTPDTAC
ncbi:hypothetical protein ACFXP3_18455 [Streptomyces sp. NPDC059096]|uniref:hypothetical protein n=1 Tax=Streptomyces sp. NPDC059096 TaxID=3346727 RepID=UPI00368DC4E7